MGQHIKGHLNVEEPTSANFLEKSLKTFAKSIVLGPTNTPAPILPNRLLLNFTFLGVDPGKTCKSTIYNKRKKYRI